MRIPRVGQRDTCAISIQNVRFVGLASTVSELWECVHRIRSDLLDMRFYRCGVAIFDCKNLLDHLQDVQEQAAGQNRAVLRYEFRHIFLMALNRGLSDSMKWNFDLPDLGSPGEELPVGNFENVKTWEVRDAFLMTDHVESDELLEFRTSSFFIGPPPFSAELLEDAANLAASLFLKSNDQRIILNLLYEARTHQRQWQLPQSFIFCWAVIERCLNILFKAYIDAAPGKDRKNRLKDGRTFSASVISEILLIKGVISQEDYDLFSLARKSRNDFMHGLKPIDGSILSDLLFAAARLVGSATGFHPSFGITLHGIR